MPIPAAILIVVTQIVTRLAPLAYKAGQLIRRLDVVKINKEYSVSIVRRLSLGADGGISQMVEILKNGKAAEIWHMVVRAGKIIHKDRKL